MITSEEYEFLKQYDDRFETAFHSNFARAIPSTIVGRMKDIYSRLIGQPYSMNTSCGGCVLNLLKKLYPYYNEYREIERNTSRQVPETEQDSGTVSTGENEAGDSKPAKKRVRSKSSNAE